MKQSELDQLDDVLEQHALWLESDGKQGALADLSGANLSGADLIYANLSRADLSGADLSGAKGNSSTVCPNGKFWGTAGNNCGF